MKDSVVLTKSQLFSSRIVRMHCYLRDRKVSRSLCDQVLRSGTSIGANIAEGHYAHSKKDFVFKMGIALKECAETQMWLSTLRSGQYLSEKQYESINNDCVEICKLLTSIVKTAKRNLSNDEAGNGKEEELN